MKIVLHVELEKDNLDLTIRELLKKQLLNATPEGQQKIMHICAIEGCNKEIPPDHTLCKLHFKEKMQGGQ